MSGLLLLLRTAEKGESGRESGHWAWVISPSGHPGAIVVSGMTHYPQINALHRATRIQLSTTPALLKLSDGKPAKAKLRTVSATGGLLHLPKALAEGDFVEVAFQTQSGNVRGMAEMLRPVARGVDVVAQPFRFVALGDDDHRILSSLVDSADHRSFIGIGCDVSNKF